MRMFKSLVLLVTLLTFAQLTLAQEEMNNANAGLPFDGIAERSAKRVLPYDHVREADIFWEKRVWRVIDIREKMNLPFAYPERPFFSILMS